MPPKALKRPGSRQGLLAATGGNPIVDRMIGEVTAAVQRVEEAQRNRSAMTFDLAIGENRIAHNLGRRPSHALITPTVADATYAAALTAADATTATITVIGVAQPGAGIVFE